MTGERVDITPEQSSSAEAILRWVIYAEFDPPHVRIEAARRMYEAAFESHVESLSEPRERCIDSACTLSRDHVGDHYDRRDGKNWHNYFEPEQPREPA